MVAAAMVGQSCGRCNTGDQTTIFCQNCGLFLADETGTVERVTFNRRFFGDNVLEALLFVFTLFIGWYIWLAVVASDAQSPAKKILKVYVIDADTLKAVTTGRVWVREVLVKQLLVWLVGIVTGVAGLIDAIWVFPDKNRQALHDKLVSTVVVYAPYGLPENLGGKGLVRHSIPQPRATLVNTTAPVQNAAEQLRELVKLKDEGILTPEEYERKRSELAGKL